MSKGKRAKKKQPFVDIYGVLLLIATIFMSIGYAEIVGTTMTIETKAEASAQEGVFITDVVCNESNSVSNNYLATTLDSSITLDSPTDTKNFTITIYNKTVKPYVFVGVKKLDKWDEFTGIYNNTNVSYTLEEKMQPHEYILAPKDYVVFNVDLGFNGQGQMPENLRSLLNFSFQEVPTLEVEDSNLIENMYPNCEEKVYEFTVSNQRQDEKHGLITNGVPLTYTIAPNVPSPLTAKIYDEEGTEVAGNKAITISSENAEEQTYTMKVKWDNTNPVNGTPYNSASYAGQTLSSSINIIATPEIIDDNDKYIGYTLDKAESVEIKTEQLYFDVTTDKTTVEMNNDSNNAEKIILIVKNNDGTNTNIFETEYKISIDNSKFTLLVNGVELGENTIKLAGSSKTTQTKELQLVTKDGQELEATENCNLIIEAIIPYAKTETIELTITDSTGPTAPKITGGTDGTYAISQTISVSEVSTDVGTGVGKYQYLLNNTESTETESIADVTTTGASQTFTEDAPGYYVYFRAVDNAGNPGEWSNAQQIYIDTAEPTVGLADGVESEITIEEGESNDVASYFKYDKNGNAGIKDVTYTVNGTPIENTDELTARENAYTIMCTVTKETNLSNTASLSIKVEEIASIGADELVNNTEIYGAQIMNYENNGDPNVGWKIFHSDGENIYLIADDYIHIDYVPPLRGKYSIAGSTYTFKFDAAICLYHGARNVLDGFFTDQRVIKWVDYVTSNPTSKLVPFEAYVLDTSLWNTYYKNNIYAEYAIGGPPIELFVKAYNQTHPDLNIGYSLTDDGYFVGTGGDSSGISVEGLEVTDSTYVINSQEKASAMWIPSSVRFGRSDTTCMA